jgi:hypothetical protein
MSHDSAKKQSGKPRLGFPILIIPLVVVLLGISLLCLPFLGAFMIAGPGTADYAFALPGGLSLIRSSGQQHFIGWETMNGAEVTQGRCRYGVNSGGILVYADVTNLGWDDRYIICFQEDSPLAGERLSGWWLIDTQECRRTGPLDKTELESHLKKLRLADVVMQHPDAWNREM